MGFPSREPPQAEGSHQLVPGIRTGREIYDPLVGAWVWTPILETQRRDKGGIGSLQSRHRV